MTSFAFLSEEVVSPKALITLRCQKLGVNAATRLVNIAEKIRYLSVLLVAKIYMDFEKNHTSHSVFGRAPNIICSWMFFSIPLNLGGNVYEKKGLTWYTTPLFLLTSSIA